MIVHHTSTLDMRLGHTLELRNNERIDQHIIKFQYRVEYGELQLINQLNTFVHFVSESSAVCKNIIFFEYNLLQYW